MHTRDGGNCYVNRDYRVDRPGGHGYTPEALAREANLFVVAYSWTLGQRERALAHTLRVVEALAPHGRCYSDYDPGACQ